MTLDEAKKDAIKLLCKECEDRRICTWNDKEKFYNINFANQKPCRYISKVAK